MTPPRTRYAATCSCDWTYTNVGNMMLTAVGVHLRQTLTFTECHTMIIERTTNAR